MSTFVKRPFLAAVLLFLILVGLSLAISVPIADSICTFDHKMVHFQVEQSVSVRNLFGLDLKDLEKNGLLPTAINLKPIGWVMLLLFYIGFPTLIYLRFRFAGKKMELENGEEVDS